MLMDQAAPRGGHRECDGIGFQYSNFGAVTLRGALFLSFVFRLGSGALM